MYKFFLMILIASFLISCSQKINNDSKKIDLTFVHAKNKIGGTLVVPRGKGPFPVVLIVYGDGPSDRFSYGSASHINAFVEKGIACFTWDKQGVGSSEGNWLHQDMNMRADEAISAMEFLSKRADIEKENIGFIGFSQGGWVLPKIAIKTDKVAFYIVVGGAISWTKQSVYLMTQRLKKEGLTDENIIQDVLDYEHKHTQLLLKKPPFDYYSKEMNKLIKPKGSYGAFEAKNIDRYQFVLNNIQSDSSKDLAHMTAPLLAIWGEDDLNVDAVYNHKIYDDILKKSQHTDYKLVVFKNATHALLNSEKYNYQTVDKWDITTYINYLIDGEDIYVDGYFDFLGEWSKNHINIEGDKI